MKYSELNWSIIRNRFFFPTRKKKTFYASEMQRFAGLNRISEAPTCIWGNIGMGGIVLVPLQLPGF